MKKARLVEKKPWNNINYSNCVSHTIRCCINIVTGFTYLNKQQHSCHLESPLTKIPHTGDKASLDRCE